MFQVSGDHIARLADDDLRTLISNLCIAELRRLGLPVSTVTAGGDQNAPDGGIDVRVTLGADARGLDFIPKPKTGFQVKCEDMPRGKITKEMCPEDSLRPSIRELLAAGGAYVIVSSQGSTSDSALRSRRLAMKAALGGAADEENGYVDFYDRERIATWVSHYPGVELWLRERTGDPVTGWQGYGAWTTDRDPDSSYLLDETRRVVEDATQGSGPQTIQHGIAAMRELLRQPRGIVRLVGLSGVGKTRLVQSLFDTRIGDNPLDGSLVAYTDESLDPDPSPRDMAHRLVMGGTRAIVVVDNCNPTTHRTLVDLVTRGESNVSLITVEYDLTDDTPEETRVFRLDPSSDEILAQLLTRRAPHLSQTDARRIVEFSGGNARVALALASTVRARDSLGVLTDAGLFQRLFHQNQDDSEQILRAAEACSLVYSFDGESSEGTGTELAVLASLAEQSALNLYRNIELLRGRDLVQRRGRWRAVLPHAISNRLAAQALSRTPSEMVVRAFADRQDKRLLVSFSRRLSYLHSCDSAIEIAEKWLRDSAYLGDLHGLSDVGLAILTNIAPLAQESTLRLIEKTVEGPHGSEFVSSSSPQRTTCVRLLRALAYTPAMFDRSVRLLARYVIAQSESDFNSTVRDSFSELFHIYLSGTLAPPDQRVRIILEFSSSDDTRLNDCAVVALNAMLQADHFSSSHDFGFGARSRSFGWQPESASEVESWMKVALSAACEIAVLRPALREAVCASVAGHFRSLWRVGAADALETTVEKLTSGGQCLECWHSVRHLLRIDKTAMPPALLDRLRSLEVRLQPRDLAQRIEAYAFAPLHQCQDLVDVDGVSDEAAGFEGALRRFMSIQEDLGRELAADAAVLHALLPRLLSRGEGQREAIGKGLSLGASNLSLLWNQLRDGLASVPLVDRDVSLLLGYVAGASERNAEAVHGMLEESVKDPVLGPFFPRLQSAVVVDNAGAERLLVSLTAGLANADSYSYLGFGRATEALSIPLYRRLVLGIADLPDGYSVAVDLIYGRIVVERDGDVPIGDGILQVGREILMRIDFHRDDRHGNLDHHLAAIAVRCLRDPSHHSVASAICAKFAEALLDPWVVRTQYLSLAGTLFQYHPRVALDAFLGGSKEPIELSHVFARSTLDGSPVNRASPDVISSWAAEDPSVRYPRIAREVLILAPAGDSGALQWSSLALHVLNEAPDKPAVLNAFSRGLHPSTWSGSYSDALVPYRDAVAKLQSYPDETVRDWSERLCASLDRQIEEEKRRERDVERSFE